jgi:hypothetical protein
MEAALIFVLRYLSTRQQCSAFFGGAFKNKAQYVFRFGTQRGVASLQRGTHGAQKRFQALLLPATRARS